MRQSTKMAKNVQRSPDNGEPEVTPQTRHEDADFRSVDLYNYQKHFVVVVECKQSALADENG